MSKHAICAELRTLYHATEKHADELRTVAEKSIAINRAYWLDVVTSEEIAASHIWQAIVQLEKNL